MVDMFLLEEIHEISDMYLCYLLSLVWENEVKISSDIVQVELLVQVLLASVSWC